MAGADEATQVVHSEAEAEDEGVSKESVIHTNNEIDDPGDPPSPRAAVANGQTLLHSDDQNLAVNGSLINGVLSPTTKSEKGAESIDGVENESQTSLSDGPETADEGKPLESPTDEVIKDTTENVADYIQYIQRMEKRVTSLEATVRKATGIEDKLRKAETPTERLPVIPELRRVSWNEFKNRTKDDKTIYAVEALVGEAKYYYQQAQERKTVAKLPSIHGISEQRDPVLRIRVNSTLIISILADILDADWELEPTVFLYPFKLLARHETNIRETLKRLESTWDSGESGLVHKDSENASSPVVEEVTARAKSKERPIKPDVKDNTPVVQTLGTTVEETSSKSEGETAMDRSSSKGSKPDDIADSPEAMKDLRCLVQFMDEELTPVIQKVNNPLASRIHFRDLWHLFKPGDEVFVPRLADKIEVGSTNEEASPIAHGQNGRYQEDWRILNVAGGRRNLTAGDTVNDEELVPKKKPNPFSILCYHIDFDGQKFIVVRHPFNIRPFEGERDITSLEVYPSRLLENHSERRASLRIRGEKFREFTTFKHRTYKGPTLKCHPCGCSYDDETISKINENIDSQVVVDFHQAISSNYSFTPWKHPYITAYGHDRELDDDVRVSIWKDSDRKEVLERKDDLIHYDSLVDNEMAVSFEASDPMLRDDPDPSFVSGKALREEDLILLPPRILAFIFRNRKFGM